MAEMREKLMHFINIGSQTTASYVLIGDGVTSLTEEFNAESETKQYINQANGTTHITMVSLRVPSRLSYQVWSGISSVANPSTTL